VTVDSAGTITLRAGGATICFAKTGQATFDSPTGIKFECGQSSLTILSGGVVLASPNVTAAAGAASLLMLGKETAGTSSKTVTIEAAGVCSIKGTSALKLQEAEAVKAQEKHGSKGDKNEIIGFTPIAGSSRGHSQEPETDRPQWCEANAKPAPPSLTITSETVVTSPKDRARLRIAVGEEVRLTVTPGPAAWAIKNGEGTLRPKSESASSIVFVAKGRGGPVTIAATKDGGTASITLTVVEPESWSMVRRPGSKLRHAHGRPDCGWLGVMYLHPDGVNFQSVETREMDSHYTGTGCYAGFNGDYHGNYPLPERASDWFPMKRHTPHGTTDDIPDTIYTGDPGAQVTGAQPPFVAGSGYFPITIQWKVGTSKPKDLPIVKQEDAVISNGKCESRKGGHSESTKYNDPTSTY
jgi:hypothetical protein